METKIKRKGTRLLRMTTSFCVTWSKVNLFDSVVDPYVFGTSGLRSGFCDFYDFLSLKTAINVPSESKKQKTHYFLLIS
jgi:hypothetical protein